MPAGGAMAGAAAGSFIQIIGEAVTRGGVGDGGPIKLSGWWSPSFHLALLD